MGLLRGLIRTGVSRLARLDTSSNALMRISHQHHKVHAGEHYMLSYSVADIGALTTPDDMMTLSFTTPATTKYLHMVVHIAGSAGALYKVIEGKTGAGASPTGTIQSYNNNRNSSNVSGILDVAGANAGKVSYDATAFTGGTELKSEYLVGYKSSGNLARAEIEFVLKASTLYQISLYNAAANSGTITMTWYEHTDKD